jgi:hypothetical protein
VAGGVSPQTLSFPLCSCERAANHPGASSASPPGPDV